MANTTVKGPIKLVTVNTAPERAFRLIGRVAEGLKEKYTIIHAANCQSITEVGQKVTEHQPDLLFCATMWTPEEAEQIQSIARSVKSDIKTHAIPSGLLEEKGPEAIVLYLLENVPLILEAP